MLARSDSAGEVLLRLVSTVERYKLDTGIDNLMRTEMAPDDALRMLKCSKLDIARNPSAMLTSNAQAHVKFAKEKHLLGVVPMLKRIDTLRDAWVLDEETESWLKFCAPSSRVLQWLDEIEKELPRGSHSNSSTFVKGRVQRFLCELTDSAEGRRASEATWTNVLGELESLQASHTNSSRDPPPATPSVPRSAAPARRTPPRSGRSAAADASSHFVCPAFSSASQRRTPSVPRSDRPPPARAPETSAARPVQRDRSRSRDRDRSSRDRRPSQPLLPGREHRPASDSRSREGDRSARHGGASQPHASEGAPRAYGSEGGKSDGGKGKSGKSDGDKGKSGAGKSSGGKSRGGKSGEGKGCGKSGNGKSGVGKSGGGGGDEQAMLQAQIQQLQSQLKLAGSANAPIGGSPY